LAFVSTDTVLSAGQTLAELEEARARASARVDELEAEQRRASEAVAQASGLLADLERRALGGETVSAATRREAENALARARVEAEQPWPERLAGARAAVRDAHQQVHHFTAAHLDELVRNLERDGEVAAKNLTSAAEAVVAAFHVREAIAHEIGETCTSAGARLRPGDVTRWKAEQLVAAASELLDGGGELAPRLRRDPRQPIHGKPEAVPAG
jgi:hypothetical protein